MTERERELLAAVVAELEASGYEGLTVDAVAARARASKATLYRRWPSKLALVVAAVGARYDNTPFAAPPSGSLREQLLAHVRVLVDEARGATVSAVMDAANRHPELRVALNEHFVEVRRDAMVTLLSSFDVPDGVDRDLVAALPAALVYARVLLTGEALDDSFAQRVVDGVLMPLLTS